MHGAAHSTARLHALNEHGALGADEIIKHVRIFGTHVFRTLCTRTGAQRPEVKLGDDRREGIPVVGLCSGKQSHHARTASNGSRGGTCLPATNPRFDRIATSGGARRHMGIPSWRTVCDTFLALVARALSATRDFRETRRAICLAPPGKVHHRRGACGSVA